MTQVNNSMKHWFLIYLFFILGDDAMFGDAEHYKYLTNEADLNNANDDSIALTPKTPKRVKLCFFIIINLFFL